MNIRAEGLTMRYNDAGRVIEIFRGLNLEIHSGSSVAIVGESGVGKTTLLFLLGALECPTEGNVHLGELCISDAQRRGEDIAPYRGKRVGFIFQSHHLLPEFDALENVAMPLIIRGETPASAKLQARELLQQVGLEDRLMHRPGMLSGGEQQRVAIARALCGQPGVVLADEPTGNLDVRTGEQVSALLLDLHQQRKMTLVVVTHSLELAGKMNRVLELKPTGLVERFAGGGAR